MRFTILFLLLFSSASSNAQLQNTWMTGHFLNPIYPKGGIDFSSGSADTFSLFRDMPFLNTNSMICDSVGNLLFYTNGIYIANSNHDTLLNSENFNPGYSSTVSWYGLNILQGLVIIPNPGNHDQYFILHTSSELFSDGVNNQYQPFNLSYSLVDIALDSGKGGVISNKKNILLINDTLTLGHITATKHANGRDWWLLIHRYQSDLFYKILVTPDTIQVMQQNIGLVLTDDFWGQAAFSTDGSNYALFTDHSLELYDFDRCTGDLSYHRNLHFPDSIVYKTGLSFSPNSRFLYANTQTNIYQYDLYSTNIDSSVQLIAEWDTAYLPFATIFFNNQLAPDGRIYIGTFNGDEILHYINYPDSLGINCNVVQNNFYLPSRNASIPTYPNYQLGRLIGSPCDTLSLGITEESINFQFSIYPNPGNGNFTFEFNDNYSGDFIITNLLGEIMKTGTFENTRMVQCEIEGSSGVYFVNVNTGKTVLNLKLVKS